MRGKDQYFLLNNCQTGITPAYAGKSRGHQRCPAGRWDHPRVCGEKAWKVRGKSDEEGSPPRMRGKDKGRLSIAQGFGITPAYAGKSAQTASSEAATRDHPRVCGEKQ